MRRRPDPIDTLLQPAASDPLRHDPTAAPSTWIVRSLAAAARRLRTYVRVPRPLHPSEISYRLHSPPSCNFVLYFYMQVPHTPLSSTL
uniref:Uncharacterized protein n=1 Tax=Leersia perrieri TaxID=77586 RepID=A0A0D9XP16_9ORYZ